MCRCPPLENQQEIERQFDHTEKGDDEHESKIVKAARDLYNFREIAKIRKVLEEVNKTLNEENKKLYTQIKKLDNDADFRP